jgi:hypothetical protein
MTTVPNFINFLSVILQLWNAQTESLMKYLDLVGLC